MPKQEPDIVIFHLSDLHFGPFLQGVSRVGEWSSFSAPHDFGLLAAMEATLDLNRVMQDYGDRLIVVVTGDMTTAAEPPAYEAVNNYIRDNPFVASDHRVGLRISEKMTKIFVVPGNHDMWIYGNLFSRWKGYANRREQYNRYFREPLPNAYPLVINGISLTIFTIDTNRVTKLNPLNFKNVLGRGEVGKAQLANIHMLDGKLSTGDFPVPVGFDYNTSLKIALMHHHLALPAECANDFEQNCLLLEDAEMVANALSNIGVQLVLCGHQHFPYHIPDLSSSSSSGHKIFLSCAGSATQIGCARNSFSAYEIRRGDNRFDLTLTVYEADAANDTFFTKGQEKVYSI
jgi:3',5'-cyclic AMP phosphodiesterase CpdA